MTRRTFIFLLLTAAIIGLAAPRAQAQSSREYQIKAAFIYNFIQFIDWPARTFPDSKSPIVIATLGPDPFNGALDEGMKGRTVEGRPLVVRHFAGVADAGPCQVLFVAAADDQLPAAIRKLGPAGLLTIGETEQFIKRGGIIRFFQQGNRLRFEINRDNAARAQLKIRAKLLRLAGEDK